MRPIDADELRKKISDVYENKNIYQMIDEMPTVDAVQVVRCKDCCWYVEDEECDPFCGHKDIYIRPDYFCADGEKVSK